MSLKRRNFLYLIGFTAGAMTFGACSANGQTGSSPQASPAGTTTAQNPQGPFQLPSLAYSYDALEPHIDARTMEFHHSRHHQAYVNNLNNAIARHPELRDRSLAELLGNLNNVPEDIRTTVRNNGGGHANHTMFWEIMGPNGGGEPTGAIANAINQNFGSFEQFQEQFNSAGGDRFGSGWVWLVRTPNGQLQITTTPNQDSPLMEGNYPIMGNDVWEHAYYLNYQNRRADYLEAWWNVVNWDAVNQRYQSVAS
ncbi:superoxide dismutase [Desertifilum sp. FACHB-1129]|uniref:Superoxide dismutase n=1 Tax=Desertifilum tharense IPPAS B-1220 TaxID=1781255 RepID=A0A1E5QNR3_9CYAN|nr:MULTISPECIES: superoxide dismutase [Desertifilum]MDA0209340.1 superoxide dismutase [Cyanobacteria bacterium FC1]MBD2311614.1 superoxide dismutase [Desertifilum sp. FACHB-1129]MBD2322861.1 superoxide dismutase [Desertifilum sp. FACHB-866]MBD2332745.1 superoxide dismutase [Desertifilum sp. FACHB-868]OEJ76305.1 superoxide dismutase [Desertifilum tharense IPPAS B-1220]